MKEKILPCPFCGCVEVEVCRTNPRACWIRCAGCGADAESNRTRKIAIENWNRRFPDYNLTEAVIISDDDRDRRFRPALKREAK